MITPPAEDLDFPTLLHFPAPHVLAYPKSVVVAEKFEALVTLGLANSRMKDFYDLWMLAQRSTFDGEVLSQALRATFDRRRIPLPIEMPLALTPVFAEDRVKQVQWAAFVRKSRLAAPGSTLPSLIPLLATFLLPPVSATAQEQTFAAMWAPSRPWPGPVSRNTRTAPS